MAEGGRRPAAARTAGQRRGQGTRRSARRSTGRFSTSPSGWPTSRVLDPACGSGNFLYVAIHMLLDLEKEVIAYAASRGLSLVPHVSPRSFTGWRSTPTPSSLPRW